MIADMVRISKQSSPSARSGLTGDDTIPIKERDPDSSLNAKC